MNMSNKLTIRHPVLTLRAALALLAGVLALTLVPSPLATVLDNFAGAKTGWTDTLNSGTVTQSGGQFTVATATGNGALTYSIKSSSAFTNLAGHTLEFRVDVNSVSPGNGDPNPLAILAWVPSGGAVLGSGYSVALGGGSVSLQKGAAVLYSTNYLAAATNIQNTNITLVLRMTPAGSAVAVNARVYKRIPNGQIGEYFTTLFEYTATDSSGLIGQAGNAALGVKNQASPTGASVSFANLQVFDLVNSVLDDFNNNPSLAGWTVFKKNAPLGDSVTVNSSGQLDVLATIADASGGFAGIYSADQTFKIIDGGRVEFQLDVVENVGGQNSYSALGYLPVASPQYIYGIISYHIASDYVGHTLVVNGKGYNEWWGGRNDIQPPTTPPGSRYTITMTGEGNNCRIESRIEDLSIADVNDPGRVLWQTEFVDTPAADTGLNEATLGNLLPYLNLDGRFIITTFNSGAVPPLWADAIYDNAVVHQTLPPVAAPIMQNVTPSYGANFLANSTTVSFDAASATNIPLASLVVTLNGVDYTNGSAGVTITPTTTSSTSRHFSLANALAANVNYVGNARAGNDFGLTAVSPLIFDTFLTNDFVIESEEYNFSSDAGITGGAFIDNPLLISEGNFDPNAYNSQAGLAEVDFHDNRGPWVGGYDANHTFRTTDPVYTSHSGDPARAKYVKAGGINAGFYEEEITDINNGDWLNYTHHYPAGTYNVFLRQATFKLPNSLVTLERVTSDRTQPNQTTTILGSFAAIPTGIGLFVNVPLTDGPGNPVVLRFSGGVDTLRVMERVTGNADLDVGSLEQNYLVLVPVADPGTLRPLLAMVSPPAGATFNSAAPAVNATIVNRDTTLNAGTLLLQLNGQSVTPSVTTTSDGATISYTLPYPLPPSGSLVTNTLIFQDSGGVYQTNSWTWALTYAWLRAANSLPLGSLSVRGFDVRTVQTANGGVNLDNSLLRANQQLAIPPEIPYEVAATSLVQVLNWNQNGTPANVPGLCTAAEIKNIATESLGYLELTAGLHRFHIVTDDRAGLYSGANLKDPNAVVIWEAPDNTANTTFDFVVEADGLYPVRCIWEQAGGGAVLSLTSVNLSDSSETVVNDPADPAGVVKAWYPLACVSSATVTGPYRVDIAAANATELTDVLCNGTQDPLNKMLVGGTLTVPQSGTTRFYRIDGPRSTRITSVSEVGSSIVLKYRVQ